MVMTHPSLSQSGKDMCQGGKPVHSSYIGMTSGTYAGGSS